MEMIKWNRNVLACDCGNPWTFILTFYTSLLPGGIYRAENDILLFFQWIFVI